MRSLSAVSVSMRSIRSVTRLICSGRDAQPAEKVPYSTAVSAVRKSSCACAMLSLRWSILIT